MGSEILVGERNWETVDYKRSHSVELHGDWSWQNITGRFNWKRDICW